MAANSNNMKGYNMKKVLYFLSLLIVLATGCRKQNFEVFENSKNNMIPGNSSECQNNIIISTITDDLDNNGELESIILYFVKNASEYDLILTIGNRNYIITNVCTKLDDLEVAPNIQILELTGETKYMMVIYSLKKQGGTDGDYYFSLLKYVNDSIVTVNDGNILLNDFKCDKYNDHISLRMSEYNINYIKAFDKDSGYYSMMNNTDEVSSEYRKNSKIKTTCIENIGVHDFDNDGIKEIITQSSIELEMGKTYIGSLYLLYKLDDSNLSVKKAFILDHTSIQSRIIKLVIENGYYDMNSRRTDELEIWLDEDIKSNLRTLEKNNILMKLNDTYFLK